MPVYRVDHYEIGEGGCSDCLPRKALVCSCGVSFSVGAPLPGCAWLAVLRWHALRNGLERSGRIGIFKMHGKKGFKQVLERSDGVWGFSKTKFYFEQKKIDQKLANGHPEQLSGKSAAKFGYIVVTIYKVIL